MAQPKTRFNLVPMQRDKSFCKSLCSFFVLTKYGLLFQQYGAGKGDTCGYTNELIKISEH